MTEIATGPRRRHSRLRGLFTMGLYQPVFLLAFLLYSPVLLWRMALDPRYRRGVRERMGFVSALPGDGEIVWIHGVSVGEVKAASNIIARLRERWPSLQLVISSTTPTGHQMARQEHPDLSVIFYPLDFGRFPGRALDRVRPRCVLLMELEIWPNFLQAAARREIPVGVINGRISERTFRGYRLARGLLPQLDLLSVYCVQDQVYRQRLLDLGVGPERVFVTGNMKYDSVLMVDCAAESEELRRWLAADGRQVVVAGSTHGDEEVWVADALTRASGELGRKVRLVLVPRHPERAGGVRDALHAAGHSCARWSELGEGAVPMGDRDILLVDTIGQLQRFYGACDVAFVGGSLVPHGGQNMLEPAAQGRAVVFGPHVSNFQTDVDLLLRAEAAIQVRDRGELAGRLAALLGSDAERARLGERAVALIRDNEGATVRTLDLLRPILGVPDEGATRPRPEPGPVPTSDDRRDQ